MTSISEYNPDFSSASGFQHGDTFVCWPTSVEMESGWWTRDLESQITSMLANTTPYDHITPPPSDLQLETPRPFSFLEESLAVALPHDAPRPAADSHTPRPAPREDQHTAQDALYYPVTKSPTFSGSTFSASFSRKTTISRRGRNSCEVRQPLLNNSSSHRRHSGDQRTVDPRDLLRGMTPLTPTTPPTTPKLPTMATKDFTAKPKEASTWATSIRKKRSPSEIFNLDFSFARLSRRRAADRTPQISPRSSFSSDSSPSKPKGGDSPKRQRTESPESLNTVIYHGGSRSPTHNTHGYNMGPAPTGPANIWGYDDTTIFQSLTVSTSNEAHPGLPVDFSRFPSFPCTDSISCDTPIAPPMKRVDSTKVYHDFVSTVSRRNSSCHDSHPITSISNIEALNKESRILDLNSSRKTTGAIPPPPPSSSTGSSASSAVWSAGESRVTSRTSSCVSDPSTEAFLTHVRASQEARMLRKAMQCGLDGGNAVFVDEYEGGTWGDGPL